MYYITWKISEEAIEFSCRGISSPGRKSPARTKLNNCNKGLTGHDNVPPAGSQTRGPIFSVMWWPTCPGCQTHFQYKLLRKPAFWVLTRRFFCFSSSADSPPVEIKEGWSYKWGDSPADGEGIPLWAQAGYPGWESCTTNFGLL